MHCLLSSGLLPGDNLAPCFSLENGPRIELGPLEMQIQHTQLYALLHIGGGGGGDVIIGSARLP